MELLLSWDQSVALPEAAADARATQTGALASAIQRLRSDPTLGAAISRVKATEMKTLGLFERANVRLAAEDYAISTKLSEAWVRRESAALAEAYDKLFKAREKNDFSIWVPALKEIFEVYRERAKKLAPKMKPLDFLVAENCGLSNARVTSIFADLKKDLVPLLRRVRTNGTAPNTAWLKNLKLDDKKLGDVMESIVVDVGVDPKASRLDRGTASSTTYGMVRTDARVTVAESSDNLKGALTALMFVAGGTLRQQGKPKSQDFLPVAHDTTYALDFLTNLLYERRVTLSRPYAAYVLPKLRAAFPDQFPANVTVDVFYSAMAAVNDPPMIRRGSDELSYTLHLIMRAEIDAEILNGVLAIANVPKAWASKMKEYLGVVPKSDNEGALQDVQWALGYVGAWPAYAIGSMGGVQLYDAAVRKVPGLEAEIAKGNFKPLKTWLAANVWSKGAMYETIDGLMKAATGKPLDPSIYTKYLTEKYTKLYKL